MDLQEIKETEVWQLYEIGRNYHRMTGIYRDTDRNWNFYNGNQWEGAKMGDVEPVQKNFIKPIVKYKLAVIHDNLYAIVFSSQNFETEQAQKDGSKICEMLNRYEARVWEKDKLDFKGRRACKDAAVNDEGIIYVNWDVEKMMPVNEVLDKADVYYGNENSDDIQSQPYILIRKRMPVTNAVEMALNEGMSDDKINFIIGDNDTFEQSGEAAKLEVDDMCTIVYKLYKKDDTVHFSAATRFAEIIPDTDIGITRYPLAHMVWEQKKGSARGEGEVRYLIPNQIEVNRTEVRRIITVKFQAYPTKVVDVSKIANPQALKTVGGVLETQGQAVDDVHKVVGSIPPAQMSPDVIKLQEDLIQFSRDLAGAGDTATGQVDPESASGRAILAVQQASQAPMTEQKETFKNFVEDLGLIHQEYLVTYAEQGIYLEDVVTDPISGEEMVTLVHVSQEQLRQAQASIKIEVTPRGVYDRFAQEQSIENLLVGGFFNPERVGELEIYMRVLPDDSVAPKQRIKDAVKYIRDQQRKIAMIQQNAEVMQQRVQQFLMDDPEGQGSMMADAQMQLMMEQAMQQPQIKGEAEVIEEEKKQAKEADKKAKKKTK